MTTENPIHERARHLVSDHLGYDIDRITSAASFIDDLGADSLDTVELAMAVEECFKVEMDDDTAEEIFNGKFGDLTNWLDKQPSAA